jgi:plasmid stability protein
MAQLIVRNLDPTVKEKLRSRAARHGRSMEEEVRDILCAAVAADDEPPRHLGTWLSGLFTGIGLEEDIPELHGHVARPASFEG